MQPLPQAHGPAALCERTLPPAPCPVETNPATIPSARSSSLAAFLAHRQHAAHHARQPLPISRVFRQLLSSPLRNRIELRLSIVLRRSPLGVDPPPLLPP